MKGHELALSKDAKKHLSLQETATIVTFCIGNHLFGVPADKVVEINKDLEITRVPLASDYIKGIMNLRGQILTVIDLGKKLGIEYGSKHQLNLIVRNQDEMASLLIERIDDILEIPVIKLEEPPEIIEGIKREFVEKVYQLPDRLLIILNMDKIFDI
uniref:Chemotaxis protein CheW n=1 Tax=Caldimicrobium thiodismutans TaxID=1653476 RepID=A0A832LVI8_9BACT